MDKSVKNIKGMILHVKEKICYCEKMKIIYYYELKQYR